MIAGYVRRRMADLNIDTQAELTRRCDISQPLAAEMMTGIWRTSTKKDYVFAKMARGLHVDVGWEREVMAGREPKVTRPDAPAENAVLAAAVARFEKTIQVLEERFDRLEARLDSLEAQAGLADPAVEPPAAPAPKPRHR